MTLGVRRVALGDGALGLGRPVAAIGNFDGLHLGHRHTLLETMDRALRRGEPSAVITFDPHPVKVLHPGAGFGCLRTLDQRLAALAAMGVGLAVVVRFDAELAATLPREFVERILVGTVGVSEVLVGQSFRFGHRRAGDYALLATLGSELGFAAHAIEPVLRGGRPISSTRVREAIAAGDVEEAAELLGDAFAIEGRVVPGAGRGRMLGFPTANLETGNEVVPGRGVYATRVQALGRRFAGATFLGEPATFGSDQPVIETHLLDFPGGDLYGERLAIEFVARLREQVKFPDAAALRAQIERDVSAARERVAI